MKITLNWLREFVDVVLSPGRARRHAGDGGPRGRVGRGAPAELGAGRDRGDRERRAAPQCRPLATLSGATGPTRPSPSSAARATCRRATRWRCAVPGTVLPDGKRIEQASIRGQTSHGMLCSARELGLSEEDGGGIMILPPDAPVGTPLVAYLGAEDTIFELSVTPNRGDCLSVLGVAREVAALTGATLRDRPVTDARRRRRRAARIARVEVQAPDLCPHYSARVVRGVRVGPSPLVDADAALDGRAASDQQRRRRDQLRDAGARTALARLRSGAAQGRARQRAARRQPAALRDARRRRRASCFPTIWSSPTPRGRSRSRESWAAPTPRFVRDTVDVLLESAFFTPETVRRTARRLGVSTESSYRFERGVDPAGTTDGARSRHAADRRACRRAGRARRARGSCPGSTAACRAFACGRRASTSCWGRL